MLLQLSRANPGNRLAWYKRPYRYTQEAKTKEMHAKKNKYRHTHNYIENI